MSLRPLRMTLILILIAALMPTSLSAFFEWQPAGPSGGDQFDVEISPTDPQTLFSLAAFGSYRSRDGGVTWEPVHTSEMAYSWLLSLAFDPQDATRVFLASTAFGVWESQDLGDTWTQTAEGLPVLQESEGETRYYPVVSLAFDENDRLFAGMGESEDGLPPCLIYRLDEGTGTWVESELGIVFPSAELTQSGTPLTQNVNALLSNDPTGHLWAMVYGAGVYALDGDEWFSHNGDLPTSTHLSINLTIDPSDGQHLLLGTEFDWIYETRDGGTTWTQMPLPTSMVGLEILPLTYGITIDPNNDTFLHVQALDSRESIEQPLFHANSNQLAGAGFYVSVNGGVDWLEYPFTFYRVVPDASEVVADGYTRSKNWYCTSGGFRNMIKSDDGFSSLELAFDGIDNIVVNAVWTHPSPPAPYSSMTFAAGEAGLAMRTEQDDEEWNHREAVDNPIYTWSFAADPNDSNAVYYSTGNPAWSFADQRGIYRITLDCFSMGCSAREQILSDVGVWRVLTLPSHPDTIYAACQEDGVMVSHDQGTTWDYLNDGLTLPVSITDLVLDQDGVPVFASFRDSNGNFSHDPPEQWAPEAGEPGGLYRFDSQTSSWELVDGVTGAAMDLETHPGDPSIVYLGTSEGIYKKDGDEADWEMILEDMVINDLLVDPNKPAYVYAATLYGIVRSTDGGEQWHEYSSGLLLPWVTALALDEVTDIVYAATAGNSVFALIPDPNPETVIRPDPDPLDCGIAPVGLSGFTPFAVYNDGEADLVIDAIVPESTIFTVPDFSDPITIPPGCYHSLVAEFSPDSLGPVVGQISLESNDPNTPAFAYELSGEGREAVPPEPDLTLNGQDGSVSAVYGSTFVAVLNLTGNDYVGEEADYWLRITLAGTKDLWWVYGQGWVESTEPVLMMTDLIPEQLETVTLNIEALLSGPGEIFFAVDGNADGVFDETWEDSVSFTVEQAPPVLYVTPGTIEFEPVPVGFSKVEAFVFTNIGEQDLIIESIQVQPGVFELLDLPALPLTIPTGENFSGKVRFSPASLGSAQGEITFTTGHPQTPGTTIPVTGEGRAAVPPVPDVKLDGQDGPVEMPYGADGTVTLDLTGNDYATRNADYWWRMTLADSQELWFVQGTGWVESDTPVLMMTELIPEQMDTISAQISEMPSGAGEILFAVDDNADGVFDGTWSDTLSFTVVDSPPVLYVTPPDGLVFGAVPTGFEKTLAFGFSNAGEQDLTVTSIEISGGVFEVFDLPQFPLTVSMGENFSGKVRFSPVAVGPADAQITFNSDDPANPALAYTVSGDGETPVVPVPDVKVNSEDGPMDVPFLDPVRLDLMLSTGSYQGQSADFWVRLTLPDGTDLWLTTGQGWVASETPQLFFTIPVDAFPASLPFDFPSLPPGDYEMFFAVDENADGVFDGTWSDAASFTVLEGPPALVVPFETISIDQVGVGLAKTTYFWLANGGGQDLVVDALTIDAPEFTLVDPPSLPSTLATGEYVLLTVQFAPTETGPSSATFTITSNCGTEPTKVIDLDGTGVVAVPPQPLVKINGLSGDRTVQQGAAIPMSVELDAGGYAGTEMEWWISLDTSAGTLWLTTQGWQMDASPLILFTTPIGSFDPITILNAPLWAGDFTLTFTLDNVMNGTYDPVWTDSAVLTIE